MEYKNLFNADSVLDVITSVSKLFKYDNSTQYLKANKVELFFQWLEIYCDQTEDNFNIRGLQIDRFPFEIFGYTEYFEFIKDTLPHLILFYCLKAKAIDSVKVSELFELWTQADLSMTLDSKNYYSILSNFKIFS